MQFIQLSPLWNRDHQWKAVLATGSASQLQYLHDLLTEQSIAAQLPCHIVAAAARADWPLLPPLANEQLQLGLNCNEDMAQLPTDVFGCGAWYTLGAEFGLT